MKHLFKLACLGAAMAAAPFAQADTLNVVAQGTFGTAVTGGTVNNTVSPTPNAGDPTPFTVVYGEQIFVGGTSPFVYCSTCLNFVFQFKNIGAVNDPILQTSMASFGSFLTTEAYSLSGAGEVAPNSVTRTGTSASSTVTFNFDNGVPNVPGNGSLTDQMIVFTNATSFGPGVINFADGAVATGGALLPTSAATPEPSSLVLLGSGLVSAAGMMLRRRRIA